MRRTFILVICIWALCAMLMGFDAIYDCDPRYDATPALFYGQLFVGFMTLLAVGIRGKD